MTVHMAELATHPAMASIIARARPSIAAVIVSWRTGPLLFACVESALAAPDIDEVILVDNGNPRETRVRLITAAAARKDFRIVWGQGNVGFAKGCNLGARHARSERLLFLNPDAVIEPGAALRLAEAGENAPRPWVAGGRVLGSDGREQRGARRGAVTLWSAFVECAGLTRFSGAHAAFRTIHYQDDPTPELPARVPTVSGACMMMRADDFRALGGFDERYFLHVEDVDLCRTARERGGAVVFAPDAVAVHEGATSPTSSLKIAWYKGVGLAKYFVKFSRNARSRTIAVAAAPMVVAAAVLVAVARAALHKRLARPT